MHKDRAQREKEKKVGKARYKDLTGAHEVMTYAIKLLGGKPTHNIALSAEHRLELEALIHA
jgi:hypothetical protein